MAAVIYARYSSTSQREESIEGQIRICTDYATARGLEVTGYYIDRAKSGRDAERRLDFQRMIQDAQKGLFDTVIVYKTDRFSRSKRDSAVYKTILRKAGVSIRYAAESIPDGPEGILMESVMEGLAEYYSAELSQKIKRGLHENALKCKATGNTPLGYQVGPGHTYELNPNTYTLVQKIFELYVSGAPIREITDYLNQVGAKTVKGNAFNKNSLRNILANQRYCGVYIYKDVVVPGGMPAIITEETFLQAQEETKRRKGLKRMPKRSNYMLSGKLFCGDCHAVMKGESGTSKTGKKYCYYSCSCKRIARDWLETLVVEETVKFLQTPGLIEEIAKKCVEVQDASRDQIVKPLKAQLTTIENSIKNIQRAIEMGSMSETLLQRLAELEENKKDVALELKKADSKIFHLTDKHITFLLQDLMTPGEDMEKYKQKIIKSFIAEVVVFNDYMEITFNLSGPNDRKGFPYGENWWTRLPDGRTQYRVGPAFIILRIFCK